MPHAKPIEYDFMPNHANHAKQLKACAPSSLVSNCLKMSRTFLRYRPWKNRKLLPEQLFKSFSNWFQTIFKMFLDRCRIVSDRFRTILQSFRDFFSFFFCWCCPCDRCFFGRRCHLHRSPPPIPIPKNRNSCFLLQGEYCCF